MTKRDCPSCRDYLALGERCVHETSEQREDERIQGLVDMAEAYWDERTALRARVAELEAFEAAAKARMIEYAKTNGELADWVTELKAERDRLAAVAERVREQLRIERAELGDWHVVTALRIGAVINRIENALENL